MERELRRVFSKQACENCNFYTAFITSSKLTCEEVVLWAIRNNAYLTYISIPSTPHQRSPAWGYKICCCTGIGIRLRKVVGKLAWDYLTVWKAHKIVYFDVGFSRQNLKKKILAHIPGVKLHGMHHGLRCKSQKLVSGSCCGGKCYCVTGHFLDSIRDGRQIDSVPLRGLVPKMG
jgi:hypothetical protein